MPHLAAPLVGLLLGSLALAGCSSAPDDSADRRMSAQARSTSPTQPATQSPTPAPGRGGAVHYVALGDSFVSGPGIGRTTGGWCARSPRNFPSLLAERLRAVSFTDASCAGAMMTHYTSAQGENPPQFDALSDTTTLVTLGMMGGNDVGLVQLAGSCVSSDCTAPAATRGLAARTEGLRPAVVRSIQQVRKRAPRARILVIGYGTYLPGHSCRSLPSVTDAEARTLQRAVDRLSDTIAAAAAQEDVEFVDLRSIRGSRQHTACAALDRQWIRGLDAAGDGFIFHPSSAGMAAVARRIAAVAAR